MTTPRKPGFLLPVAVTLAVLLGLYVGAYYAMVRPVILSPYPAWAAYVNADPVLSETAGAKNRKLRVFFAPIHWLDRRLRPNFWDPVID